MPRGPGPYSLWSDSATPYDPADPDSSAVEVGVKFTSDVAGSITGVRFYKGSGNTGTHVGNLWDSNGNLLATATFSNETASGWQQVNFATPVAIQPNTIYVASYHTNTGHYADDPGYFNGGGEFVGYSNGPLHAPADGAHGPNGVYAYGRRSNFPTNGWEASNYWVDVVFSTSTSTATTYTLTPPVPATGSIGVASGLFTVALPTGQTVSAPVTVIPNDGGARGTFTPAQEILSNASPTATFTYTAASVGTCIIAATNNGGLNNPAPVMITASNPSNPGVTYSLSGPTSGEVERGATFTITLGPGTLPGTVHFTPSASNGDGAFSPASIDLSDTVRSGSFTYTPTLWGARTIVTTNNGGLTNPAPLSFLSEVQLGSSGTAPSGNRGPDLGGFNFFTTGAWWQELGRSVLSDPVAPNSAALLAGFGSQDLHVDWDTTTANGGNSMYGTPYNVVPGNQVMLPVTLGAYADESDPGPAPYFPGMSIEGVAAGVSPTLAQINDGGDHHGLVLVRDETTGGISKIYEGYSVYSPNGDGSTWGVTGSQAIFDLTTGAPRPEGWTSTAAAGLPITPLLVRYDEAARGAIDHPIRCAIGLGSSLNAFVWPARHAVYSGSNTSGLPMGARLRLSQSWYDANYNSFSPIDRAIIDAMRNYGVIVGDLADNRFWIEGVNDERWNQNDLMALRTIPVSAFEVLNTIKSPVSFTGPTTGPAGVPQTYTLQYLIAGNSNFSTSLYIFQSSDGGTTWTQANLDNGWFLCDDTHRGPFTLTFTPPAPGTYLLRIENGGRQWIVPPQITFTATAPAAPAASTSSPANPATSLTGAASGASTFALPMAQTVSAPVTVVPSDGGAGGTFTPAQAIVVNGATTPAQGGAKAVSRKPKGTLADWTGSGPMRTVALSTPSSSIFGPSDRAGMDSSLAFGPALNGEQAWYTVWAEIQPNQTSYPLDGPPITTGSTPPKRARVRWWYE
jgi:hypothetical protein